MHLTAVSEAELRFGFAITPPRRRRDGLAQGLERMLRSGFANSIVTFDSAQSIRPCRDRRPAVDRLMPEVGCQITAVACSRGMAVAMRNAPDFADTGIDVIDPWTDP